MIIDIVLLLLSSILRLFSFMLAPLVFFPAEISTAIASFFGNFGYLHGLFPVVPVASMSGLVHTVGILTVVGWAIKFITYFYMVKLVLWLVGLIPFFKHKSMPHSSK